MTKSKNYYRVKEALYKHFPKEAIVDYPFGHSVYLFAQYYFKDEGQTVLIYYAKDRLLYPHHLEYGYTGVDCKDKDNNIISKYNEYLINLSPNPKDIKLKKIKDDF